MNLQKCFSFLDQLQPESFCILQRHRKIHLIHNRLFQLRWEQSQFIRASLVSDHFGPPITTLTWYICSRDDPNVWIDQKECQNFAVTWSSRILKLERVHSMLIDVRENNDAAFLSENGTKILQCLRIIFATVYLL